jgi:hypothetical protein
MPNLTRRALARLLLATGGCALLLYVTRPRPTPLPAASPARLGALPLIARAEWGAAAPNHKARGERGHFDPQRNPAGWLRYPEPLAEVLTTLVVHHSALPLSDGPREIQHKHMKARGFADIGYHFLIDSEGLLYEGRELGVRGAHTAGHNTGTVGVALLGNFEEAEPLPEQLATLEALARYLQSSYAITHLAGHQAFQPGETLCPGQALAPEIPRLAARLALEVGTGGYRAPLQP